MIMAVPTSENLASSVQVLSREGFVGAPEYRDAQLSFFARILNLGMDFKSSSIVRAAPHATPKVDFFPADA